MDSYSLALASCYIAIWRYSVNFESSYMCLCRVNYTPLSRLVVNSFLFSEVISYQIICFIYWHSPVSIAIIRFFFFFYPHNKISKKIIRFILSVLWVKKAISIGWYNNPLPLEGRHFQNSFSNVYFFRWYRGESMARLILMFLGQHIKLDLDPNTTSIG